MVQCCPFGAARYGLRTRPQNTCLQPLTHIPWVGTEFWMLDACGLRNTLIMDHPFFILLPQASHGPHGPIALNRITGVGTYQIWTLGIHQSWYRLHIRFQ